jgi:hypothetical protein
MKMCPCPGQALVESSCFTSAVAKLRLDGTPTPRSRVARMNEAAWHQPVRVRAPPAMEAGPRGRTMTHDLPRNDADNGEPPLQVARQYRRDDGFRMNRLPR